MSYASDDRLRCVECGDVIGAYEPLWCGAADGSVFRASLLAPVEALESHRLWHIECFAGGTPSR
jgi:hypothetical protein